MESCWAELTLPMIFLMVRNMRPLKSICWDIEPRVEWLEENIFKTSL